MLTAGPRARFGLLSPGDRPIERGDPLTTAFGIWGALNCRAGFVVEDAAELPAGIADYVERLVGPYFAAVVEWYEALHVGQVGGALQAIVDRHLGDPFFGIFLNPGHQLHLDEWVNSPVYPGSTIELRSGMALQCDIIPATGTPYFTTNIEDGLALADESLRAAFAGAHPAGVGANRGPPAFMIETPRHRPAPRRAAALQPRRPPAAVPAAPRPGDDDGGVTHRSVSCAAFTDVPRKRTKFGLVRAHRHSCCRLGGIGPPRSGRADGLRRMLARRTPGSADCRSACSPWGMTRLSATKAAAATLDDKRRRCQPRNGTVLPELGSFRRDSGQFWGLVTYPWVGTLTAPRSLALEAVAEPASRRVADGGRFLVASRPGRPQRGHGTRGRACRRVLWPTTRQIASG